MKEGSSVCRFCIAEEHFSSDFTMTFFSNGILERII